MPSLKDFAVASCEKAGLYAPKPPKDIPDFPDDLSVVSPMELGRLHTVYAAVVYYAQYLAQLADLDLMDATTKFEHEAARELLLVDMVKYKNVQERRAVADTQPTVVTAREVMEKARAKRELAKVHQQGYERLAGAVSREISRRQIESEISKRT